MHGHDGLVAGGDQAPLATDGPVSPQGGARAPAGAAHTAPHHVPVGEGCHPGEGQPGTAGAAGQAAGRKAMAQPEGAAAAGPGPTAPGPPGPTACRELPPPALPAPLQLLTSPAAAPPPRHLLAGLGLPSTPAPVPPLRLPSPLTVSRPTLALPHTARAGRAVPSSAPLPIRPPASGQGGGAPCEVAPFPKFMEKPVLLCPEEPVTSVPFFMTSYSSV